MMNEKKRKGLRIAFQLPPQVRERIVAQSKEKGFMSISEYVRFLVLRSGEVV